MQARSTATRFGCWVCVALALSMCTGELCLAQGLDSTLTPDSTAVAPQLPEAYEDGIPMMLTVPVTAGDDSPAGRPEDTGSPVYKKWWVWALIAVATGVGVALVAGDSQKAREEYLPDFPEPPER